MFCLYYSGSESYQINAMNVRLQSVVEWKDEVAQYGSTQGKYKHFKIVLKYST